MKLLKGRENLGKYKGIPIEVDWDYLSKEHGFRKEQEIFEKALGRFIFLASLFGIVAISFLQFYAGSNIWFYLNEKSTLGFIAWILVGLVMYAQYLRRNRDSFLDKPNNHNLFESIRRQTDKGVTGINLTDYVEHDLLNLLDDLINNDTDKFLDFFMSELIDLPSVLPLLTRIGLNQIKAREVLQKFEIEGNGNIDLWFKRMLFDTFVIAADSNMPRIDEKAFLMFLLKYPLKDILLDSNISENDIAAAGLWLKNSEDVARYAREFKAKSSLKPTSTVNRAFTSRFSPTLVKFSRDYTTEVIKDKFNFSIAREKELEKLIELVETSDASATLIVGEPGIGKTTLLKSLAVRMVVEDVPEVLKDKRLVGFDFNRAYSLAGTLEVFKSRLEKVFEESAKAQNIVLVLDDFDQVVSIREEYAEEVIGIVVNAINKFKLRVIATATPEGYANKIKANRALISLFNTIELSEPADEVTVQILMDNLPELESKFKLKIGFEALVQIVKLSHKFNFDKVLPDKAIDLLDEIITKASSQKLQFISEDLIEQVVSEKIGVKVGEIDGAESQTLMNLEHNLHKLVIGQDNAVKAVAAALRRSRAGLVNEKRPIASFLFFGPTGVGKTELSKALAKTYYGDAKFMIRLDMSEYQEEHNLQRLIGEKIGNKFEGGILADAVRSKPFSLILLDEIEKANAKVLDLFLQVLDEGQFTDGMGRKIDFTNTIIIATSNIASKQIADLLAKTTNYEEVYTKIKPDLAKYLRIEFINRFDKVIMFKPLAQIEIEQIAGLLMQAEQKKLLEKGIELSYTKETLQQLAAQGYNPVYGARELRRIVQERIEDQLAKLIVAGQVKSGSVVNIQSLDKFEIQA